MWILNSKKIAFSFLFLLFIAFFSRKIVLNNSDLGRHLMTGKVLLAEFAATARASDVLSHPVLYSNYYSYTQPDFSANNHHWLFGVLAELLITEDGSFAYLGIFNTVLCAAAFIGSLLMGTSKKTPTWLIIVVGVGALPLFTHRTEVRPESVSLFVSVFFVATFYWTERMGTKLATLYRYLIVFLLFILQILWANIHLFFILGPLIAGVFFLRSLFTKQHRVFFLIALCALLFASMLTPHGWQTVLLPVTILADYGYPIAENQSTFFMLRHGFYRGYYAYLSGFTIFALAITTASFVLKPVKKLLVSWRFFFLFLACAFGIVTHRINRLAPLFGSFVTIALLQHTTVIWQQKKQLMHNLIQNPAAILTLSTVSCIWILAWAQTGVLPATPENVGFGLYPGLSASAEFIKDRQLLGPIFNNYDSGGYLIYYLYPEYSVFIDNRPEAYSTDFIKNTYIAAQQDESRWQELLAEHNFQTIYFYALDMTDWGRPFLQKRLADPEWQVAYYDQVGIILTRSQE